MKIALIQLADMQYGGIPTYIKHVMAGLEAFDVYSVYLYFSQRPKRMYSDIGFRALNIPFNRERLESYDAIFIASGFVDAGKEKYIEPLLRLNVKKTILFHDPPEFEKSPFKNYLDRFDCVLQDRTTNMAWFSKEYPSIKARLILHPYGRACSNEIKKENLAVDIARIDWDKHQDIIVKQANMIRGKLKFYGALNKQYEYHRLTPLDWSKYYYGKFKDPIDVLRPAKVMVDMSAIKKDGGGTQYTFMEAMDAGCALVLNEKWGEEVFKDGENCLYANEENIADRINQLFEDDVLRNKIVENNYKILESRSYTKIMPEFLKFFESL